MKVQLNLKIVERSFYFVLVNYDTIGKDKLILTTRESKNPP